MPKKLYIPVIDNGMGLSRTSWAVSFASACLGVLRDYIVDIQPISYPYPDGAMNIATDSFMASDCDEMIVIDTDVVFQPIDLAKLLSHDDPLVFGLYPMKQPGMFFPVQSLDGDANPFAVSGLHEFKRCARGFMRARREVFDICKPFCEEATKAQDGRKMTIYWRGLPGGHSEDFYFCDLWRSVGGKVMVDTSICCQHEGSAMYPIPGTYQQELIKAA